MDFYRQGFLNKAGRGILQTHLQSWRPRFFVLDNSTLKYYKSRETLPENLLGCISLDKIESVSLIKNENKAFQITTMSPGKRTYYMSGESEREIQGWITALQMAKAKNASESTSTSGVPSMYHELLVPSNSPKSPINPTRLSEGDLLPKSPTTPTEMKSRSLPSERRTMHLNPVPSEYEIVGVAKNGNRTCQGKEEDNPYSEVTTPTYATVNNSSSKKSEDSTVPLYDTVSPVKSIPKPVSTPPPLPARLPSMSGTHDALEQQEEGNESLNNDKYENQSNGEYEVVRHMNKTEEAELSKETTTRTDNEQDEVTNEVDNPSLMEKVKIPVPMSTEVCDDTLYEQINSTDKTEDTDDGLTDKVFQSFDETVKTDLASTASCEVFEGMNFDNDITGKQPASENLPSNIRKTLPENPDPSHIYSKPQKIMPMKRVRSKKKLIPGLMDVGEVDINIEEDAAGGKETLKRGMTKPVSGDSFAIEELKEFLAKFDDDSNNNDEVTPGFNLNPNESAFDVLRKFLGTYN